MAKGTKIEWADDTVNAEMGCDGCELWDPKNEVRLCYAGLQTERMSGHLDNVLLALPCRSNLNVLDHLSVSRGLPRTPDRPARLLENRTRRVSSVNLTGGSRCPKPQRGGAHGTERGAERPASEGRGQSPAGDRGPDASCGGRATRLGRGGAGRQGRRRDAALCPARRRREDRGQRGAAGERAAGRDLLSRPLVTLLQHRAGSSTEGPARDRRARREPRSYLASTARAQPRTRPEPRARLPDPHRPRQRCRL